MPETFSTPLMKRMIQLLKRIARNSYVPGERTEYAITARELLAEVDAARDREVVDHLAAPLRYDIERAALDAYSVAQERSLAQRNGEFQYADHRDALMAAIDAVDALRKASADKE